MQAYKGYLEMARPQQAVLFENMMAQIDKMSKKMSPKNATTEAEIIKLILVTHSFLLKFAFLSEGWKMLNVTSLLKDTSGSSGDLKKMSMTSELGKSGKS